MATNPSTLAENVGRITAPDASYPYGSCQDDSTGTTGDGTPVKKALMNDTYGFQQWLLDQASIVPSGTADTVLASQYGEALLAIIAAAGIGYDQTWQVLTGSRATDVVYTNDTEKPIQLAIQISHGAAQSTTFEIDGVAVMQTGGASTVATNYHNIEPIIQPGSTYELINTPITNIQKWSELR